MSWRADSVLSVRAPWGFRVPIFVDCYAAVASPVDVRFTIPEYFDHFWDNTAAIAEIRVCDSDGTTLLSYSTDDASFSGGGASLSNRSVGISVDGLAVTVSTGQVRPRLIWLYYGLAGAASAAVATVIAAPYTGYLSVQGSAARVIQARPETPGETRPRARLFKTSRETVDVWFDVTSLLQKRATAGSSHLDFEEVQELLHQSETGGIAVEQSGSAVGGSPVVVSDCRFVYVRGKTLIRARVTGLTTANDYTLVLPFKTTEGQILEARAFLAVRNVSEA